MKSAKEAISVLLDGLPALKSKIKRYRILDIWAQEIEKSGASRAERIDGKTLFITAENPSLCQEIALKKREFIIRMNEQLGEEGISDIKVKIGT